MGTISASLLNHAETPRSYFGRFLKENWISIAVLLYLASPVDLIPEALFPVIGSVDDLVVALVSAWSLWKKNKSSQL